MARPLCLEFPGAVYHITARGKARELIFADDRDRQCFVDFFAREIEQQGWRCYANQNHLLFETPEPNLVRGMRLSELIPKTLGANNWEDLAPFTVRSLHWVIRGLGPLVWMSRLITGVLKKDKSQSVLSRRDFLAMAELGAKQGVIKPGESRFIHNLLRRRDRDAVGSGDCRRIG